LCAAHTIKKFEHRAIANLFFENNSHKPIIILTRLSTSAGGCHPLSLTLQRDCISKRDVELEKRMPRRGNGRNLVKHFALIGEGWCHAYSRVSKFFGGG
jgi:hypothetical protein